MRFRMITVSSERRSAQHLGSLCLTLLALTVAQLGVSFWMRKLLWPNVGALALLRSFMVHDVLVIACFAGLGLCLALIFHKSRPARLIIAALGWAAGLSHIALLAINYTSVKWLAAPLTLSWIETADLGKSATPWVMVQSVVSKSAVVGLFCALLLPLVIVALARFRLAQARAWSCWLLVFTTAVCALTVATGRPATPNQWRDAVSSPMIELWISFRHNEFNKLMQRNGDGQNSDYALRPAENPPFAPPSRRQRQPDILVVVLESVGRRAVESNISRLPTIARLVQDGTTYTNASVAVAASSRSMFSLLYSRYPRLSFQFEPQAIESGFPEPFLLTLRKAGYSTVFAQGGDFAFQSTDKMLRRTDAGPLEDYQTIECDERADRSTERLKHQVWLSDRCTYGAIERWFGEQRAPRAAMVWPVSTHFPYDYGKSSAPSGSREAYFHALQQTDRLLGEMLERLAKRGIRPVVVILGDHGEAFGEHGFVMHGQTMFEEELGIPLIISGPGVPSGKADDRLAQLQDIAPTLTAIAGIGQPCGWQGLSLFGVQKRKRAYGMAFLRRPYVGYREGDMKYILDLRNDSMAQYNLAEDPFERHPKPMSHQRAEVIKDAIAGWAHYNADLYNDGDDRCIARKGA